MDKTETVKHIVSSFSQYAGILALSMHFKDNTEGDVKSKKIFVAEFIDVVRTQYTVEEASQPDALDMINKFMGGPDSTKRAAIFDEAVKEALKVIEKALLI